MDLIELLGEKLCRTEDFSAADQVEKDNVHSEELGEAAKTGAVGVGNQLVVHPLETISLRSGTVDRVEIIHID